MRGVLTNWSSGTKRCEVKELSCDGTNTGGKGNGVRDEVYKDEKVEAGSEVSQKSNSLRKADKSGLLGEPGEAMLIPNVNGRLPLHRN